MRKNVNNDVNKDSPVCIESSNQALLKYKHLFRFTLSRLWFYRTSCLSGHLQEQFFCDAGLPSILPLFNLSLIFICGLFITCLVTVVSYTVNYP